ncbi:hypothetical protein EW026_g2019 [Hermanssonia centrifuga]|uniref:DUF6533 domain-containing protein n=1 Tax=Hermanssonia centrifuga TaxID=98765 RepID=A0A4S4KU56_9APHY|nr:hypothetical protein EW026_g2019 [Hermanssonia centrifuga]
MSQTDTPTSDTASQYQGIVLETDFIYALTAVITYEYVVTFGQEVEAMWLRKWTGATWLFLVNRYMMIAGAVIAAAPYTADTYV